MPQMGVSVAEGTIAGWLKRPGETVAADEAICEVTTDKIDVEIPAPGAGVTGGGPGRRRARRCRWGLVIARIATGPAPASSRPNVAGPRRADRMPGTGRSTAPASTRPSSGGSPRTAASISTRSRATASAGGSARSTCSLTSSAAERVPATAARGRCTPSRPTGPKIRRPSTAPRRPRAGDGRESSPGRRTARGDGPDAPRDRRAHGRQPQNRGALHDDRRGRLLLGRRRSRRAQGRASGSRGVPLTYLAYVARAVVERARASTRC